MYMLVHDLVDIDEIHAFAVVGDQLFDECAALQALLMAEVECLGGVEQLDSKHPLGVLAHAVALGGGIASHADEVFLVLAAGDAVDTAGSTELLALADD